MLLLTITQRATWKANSLKPLSILLLTSLSGPYGTEQCFADLAEELVHRGHRVTAVIPKRGWLGGQMEKRGIPNERFQLRLHSPAAYGRLTKLALTVRPNVVHAHSARATRFAMLYSKCTGTPFVTTLHHSAPGSAYWAAANAGGTVVAVSDHVCSVLRAAGVPEQRVRMIYAGTGIARDEPEPKDLRLLAEWGIPSDRFVFVIVGRITPNKGQMLAVEALAAVPERERASLHLVLAGGADPAYLGALRFKAASLGVTEHLTFAGVREDIPRVLCTSDALLLPSTAEGMPLAVLEAMCLGRPVATTAVGDLPLLIREGQNGLLFDRTPESLSRAMLALSANPDLCRRMGERARVDAAIQFHPARMAEEHEALYYSLLGLGASTVMAEA
jgi:glycosyltransferase involved in cell wall biosynthesis